MINYRDLIGIPTVDCGEPLIPIPPGLSGIITHPPQTEVLLREGCVARLVEAANRLGEASVVVVSGYREPSVQQKYFEEQLKQVKRRSPTLMGDELLEAVHKLIAVPSIAGHPTGGAVDVTILENGVFWDMGTAIADFDNPDKIPTFSTKVTANQRGNRLRLRSIMMEAGFAPFDGEWWHFSFGDKEWAYYYQKTYAIYPQWD